MAVLQLLLLLIIANGTPILTRLAFRKHGGKPVDGGMNLRDGQPLFGASKTWRGLIAAILLTPAAALIIGLDLISGLLIALMAMAGDLFSSFLKRRLGMKPSSQALGLDQIPESILPALVIAPRLQLSASEILIIVLLFFFIELGLSQLLFRIGIRKRPY